jgi:polyisoprenoid-binding protein YceI
MSHGLRAALVAALFLPAAAPLAAQAPVFTIDRAHTQVLFRVRHMGVAYVTGKFREFEGSFAFDSTNLAASSARLAIRTASVDTENDRRDTHLRSPDFFAADSFPEITFLSRQVERGRAPGTYRVTGDLTIRGITRPITLDAELVGMRVVPGQQGSAIVAGWVLTGSVNRHDYGLRWNRLIEGVNVVGDDVRITVEVEARAPAS